MDKIGRCKNSDCGRYGELREDGQCVKCYPYVFRFEKQTRDTAYAQIQPLQEMYNDDALRRVLQVLKDNGASLHEMRKWLEDGRDQGITHMDIKRALQGVMPKSNRKRKAMRLSPVLPVPACPECGLAHVHKHGEVLFDPTTQVVKSIRKQGKPRAPRLAISKDDMTNAANSIVNNISPGKVRLLIVKLLTITNG